MPAGRHVRLLKCASLASSLCVHDREVVLIIFVIATAISNSGHLKVPVIKVFPPDRSESRMTGVPGQDNPTTNVNSEIEAADHCICQVAYFWQLSLYPLSRQREDVEASGPSERV